MLVVLPRWESFGETDMSARDTYAGGLVGGSSLLYPTNFKGKGGPVVLVAFRVLGMEHPELLSRAQ